MTRNYEELLTRKTKEHGVKFDPSDLNKNFVKYYESGERVEVEFIYQGGRCDVRRGTIGVTTGWRPAFLLMLTSRSRGSCWTIGPNDKVIKVIPKRR